MTGISKIGSGQDVVSFLKEQHSYIKSLFAQVFSAQGPTREEAFLSLRRLLAVHETAEEEVVHPAARRELDNGEGIVSTHLAQEREAKTVLLELEKMDMQSVDFETKLRSLQEAVLAHAESEETKEFDLLANKLDPERLQRMAKVFELAERMAPTRPHPGVEGRGANMLVGPFVAMVDRVRDAIGKTRKEDEGPRANA